MFSDRLSDRGEWPVLNSVIGLFCQWRTNVSLGFSIRRILLESSAAAPSNETRIAQAPVAERPVALPPARRELQMWITIFALTFATAIIFSVASYMLHTKH